MAEHDLDELLAELHHAQGRLQSIHAKLAVAHPEVLRDLTSFAEFLHRLNTEAGE